MMRNYFILLTLLLIPRIISAQKSTKLTLEDMYQNNIFKINSVQGLRWMKDGNYYTSLVKNKKTNYQDILKFSTATGEVSDTLIHGEKLIPDDEKPAISISSYHFNNDESKLLLSTESTRIYRRSSKAINYVYNLKSKKLSLLAEGDKQSYATFSPDGSKVGFVRENNIYVKNLRNNELIAITSDGKKNEIINGFADWVYEEEFLLTRSFFWSPDGNKIAFFSDKTGEYELYLLDIESPLNWVQLTKGLKNTIYHLEWSPDGTKILFGNKDFTIFYVDIKSKKLVKVDSSNQLKNDEFYWEVSDYGWSPDSKWIVYSFVQFNKNNKIFLYNLEKKKKYPLTDDFYDNLNPSFDANGEYLYFLSYQNFDVRMDVFEDNHVIPNPVKVMVVQLKAGREPLFEKNIQAGNHEEDQDFRIDIKRIQDRIFPLPVKAGNYFYLKAGNDCVTWASYHHFAEDEYEEIFKPGGRTKWKLNIFDMNINKKYVVDGKISDWRLSTNREYIIAKKNSDFYVNDVQNACFSESLGDKLDLSEMKYCVNPREEWTQIFNDCWRWYRDFFYDPNMHGRDWKKMGDNYRAYIPQLTSRQDLNWVMSQMVGELCVSHTYVWGGDQGPKQYLSNPVYTGLLGADLKPSKKGYFQFDRILGPTKYNRELTSPLTKTDINLKEGDYLIAIDGKEIKTSDNPYRHLQITQDQKVDITVNNVPGLKGAKTYLIEPTRSERQLRYYRWLSDNIENVLKAS
ncbi:MAG: DPP IV N-terminal domain-containing protein, partial [Cyclobacteriaceae bacterium]|nr:DPP IV N-terminal domain-containing protein [Cyclobacteriaceae bacterium]